MKNKNKFEIFAIFTIGFPFVFYKIIVGSLCLDKPFFIIGYFLISLGVIDFLFNVSSLIRIIFCGRADFPVCFFDYISKKISKNKAINQDFWQNIGTAIDVMLSFSLVSIMVGNNLFYLLSKAELVIWNYGTATNLLGAGLSRIISTVQLRKREKIVPR
jgi:hypothetical protein